MTANVTLDFALDPNLATCVAPGYQKTYAFFDDFENGYANWTTSGLWNPEAEGDTCGSLVAPFPSSSNAIYYGQPGICTYDTGVANSGELTSTLPVSLPASGGVLEFASFEETECKGNCGYDNRYVDIGIVTTTTTWITLGEGDTEGSWYQKSFDLSAYGENNVLFRFRFDSFDSVGNDYFGWMVDDVGIKVGCAPPPSGGLVVGNVYNQNNLDPVVGAEVSNDTGEVTLALPTPDDPNVDDAFYTLFSPDGDHSFTATYIPPYSPTVETVTVLDGDAVRQDFFLSAPVIVHDPELLEAWLINGTAVLTHPVGLDIINNGGAPSGFEISEISGTVSMAAGVLPSDYLSANGAGPLSGSDVDQREIISPSSNLAATAGCLVAVTRDSGGPNETPYLHATLDEFGFSWIDINTVQDARDAGVNVIIDRYAAINLPYSDLNDWLDDGFGYVELGDWPAWFPDASEEQPTGTPLSIEVADSTHPLAKGLPAAWTGRGFWVYDWSSDALGWVDSIAYPNIVQAQYDTLHERVVSAEEVGPGRAAYIGINTYGPLAGDPDKQVLQNAIEWTGQCRFDVPWLWEDPITGTVPAEDTFNLDIMFTSLYPGMVTPMPLGTYTATLRIENNAPFAETQYVPVMMHIIEAFSNPVASFTSNSPVTLGTPVVFTNTSTEGLPSTEYYLWNFGDGQTLQVSNTDPINHDYALPGVYSVTLTAHQAQTGVEVVYTDTVLVTGYIYMPLITKNY